jgi:hypothetical protein
VCVEVWRWGGGVVVGFGYVGEVSCGVNHLLYTVQLPGFVSGMLMVDFWCIKKLA